MFVERIGCEGTGDNTIKYTIKYTVIRKCQIQIYFLGFEDALVDAFVDLECWFPIATMIISVIFHSGSVVALKRTRAVVNIFTVNLHH